MRSEVSLKAPPFSFLVQTLGLESAVVHHFLLSAIFIPGSAELQDNVIFDVLLRMRHRVSCWRQKQSENGSCFSFSSYILFSFSRKEEVSLYMKVASGQCSSKNCLYTYSTVNSVIINS